MCDHENIVPPPLDSRLCGVGHCGRGLETLGGANVGESVENVSVEPVHHMPVWRLREILAHAEGKCIMLV